MDVELTMPQGKASSTAPSGVPMLPQLPSPGQTSRPLATVSGSAGGNALCSSSLMYQSSAQARRHFSSQKRMHTMAQVCVISLCVTC